MVGPVASDVAQAFARADVGEKIATRALKDLDGVEVERDGQKLKLKEGGWLDVVKAPGGYQRSPRLWQLHFSKVMQHAKCLVLSAWSQSRRCAPT